MFDMSILGQVAPIILILGVCPLLYRLYLKVKGKWTGLIPTIISLAQMVLGAICIITAFFAAPYYDMLTAGALALIGATDILITVMAGGRFPFAAIVAIGLGVWFGYLGAATAKYKVSIFFLLFDKNVPEAVVGVALAVVIAAVAFVVLRMLQDLLQAVATALEWFPVSFIIISFCLIQASLLLAGSSLQPIFIELLNRG